MINVTNNVNLSMRGYFTIEVADAKTGELKQRIADIPNTFTHTFVEMALGTNRDMEGFNGYNILTAIANKSNSCLKFTKSDITPGPDMQDVSALVDYQNDWLLLPTEDFIGGSDPEKIARFKYNKATKSFTQQYTIKWARDFSVLNSVSGTYEAKALGIVYTLINNYGWLTRMTSEATKNKLMTVAKLTDNGTPFTLTISKDDIVTAYYTFEFNIALKKSPDFNVKLQKSTKATELVNYKVHQLDYTDFIDETKVSEDWVEGADILNRIIKGMTKSKYNGLGNSINIGLMHKTSDNKFIATGIAASDNSLNYHVYFSTNTWYNTLVDYRKKTQSGFIPTGPDNSNYYAVTATFEKANKRISWSIKSRLAQNFIELYNKQLKDYDLKTKLPESQFIVLLGNPIFGHYNNSDVNSSDIDNSRAYPYWKWHIKNMYQRTADFTVPQLSGLVVDSQKPYFNWDINFQNGFMLTNLDTPANKLEISDYFEFEFTMKYALTYSFD